MFHIVLIYALVNGLGSNIIEKLKPPMDARILPEEVKLQPLPPPVLPPTKAPVDAVVPIPHIVLQTTLDQHAIENVVRSDAAPQVDHPAASGPKGPAQPDSDVSERPIAGDRLIYPSQMLDQEREGSARVSCFVDTDGRTSGCKIDSVTGGSAFGAAALSYVKTARYRPRTHNGVPVAAPHQWNIRFSLGGGE
jgi:protein TonB